MVSDSVEFDVLVVGGGTSGAAAAWQAAKLGARTLVVEPTPWLGGMITAAGVSALDGNEGALGSGLFGRFRTDIERHYGGADQVKTGWVSNTCFEPHVAARLLRAYLAETDTAVWHGSEPIEVLRDGSRVRGARVRTLDGVRTVRARITIEATEYGDVLALGAVPFRLGREARSDTGEPDAPEHPDLELQDMTYVATLQRYPGGAPPVPRPDGYDPDRFDCATSERCTRPDPAVLDHGLHDWDGFLGYGLLPNDRFMLNWPFHSNDSPADGLFGHASDRAACIATAKARTLAFVHYIQNELGHPEWGLAAGVFPTRDGLPLIPYVRESRRVVPVRTMREQDVVPAAGERFAPAQQGAIAVGDYFLDHHHGKAHLPPGERLVESFPKNAPFQVPWSALVPESVDGLICAEKSIGVTHIVNGCTRLQPVVMLIGQAAGAAAALCCRAGVEPRALDVAALQETLLTAGCVLDPRAVDEPDR